jgi:serine 3-dehydrogenase (NADP+)
MPKTALVTGCTSGIGHAVTERFTEAGWRVIGLGRRRERLDELRAQCGDAFVPVVADVSDARGTRDAVAQLLAAGAHVDALVNNAGATHRSPLQDTSLEVIETVVGTNITGLVALTSFLLPELVKRRGSVVNVGSTAANYPHANNVVYAASKAFIAHFSACLRSDLHGQGVRVTLIEPGRTVTEAVPDAAYVQLRADDIADAIVAVAQLPPHVNVNRMEIMPVSQSLAGYQFHTEPRPAIPNPAPAGAVQ